MPSVSRKQHRLMEAAAHNPTFAAKAGVPTKVAKEFVKADEHEDSPQMSKPAKRAHRPSSSGYGR